MAKDTLIFLPAKLLEGLITMFTTAFYTDLFETAAYGRYQIINTNVLFIYLISLGWLLNSAVRYVGDAGSRENKKTFYSTVSVCYLTISAAAVVISCVISVFTGNLVSAASSVMLISYALFQIMNGMLVQMGKIRSSVVLSLSSAVVKLIGAYFFAGVLPLGASTPYPAIMAAITADLFAGVIAVIILKVPSSFSVKAFSQRNLKGLLSFGIPLVGFSISVGLLNMVDRYIVNFLCGEEAFAVYSANYSISSGLFTLLMTAIMRGVYPNLLKGWREEGKETAQKLLNSGTRLYMLIALPAAFGLLAVGVTLSDVFFTKPEYHHGLIIGIAAFVMFFMGFTEYVNKAWELTSNTLPILQNSIMAVLVKIAATFTLIIVMDSFGMGIYGAVTGSLLAFVFYFMISRVRAKKRFVFKIPAVSVLRITLSAVVCGIGAYLTLLLPINKILAMVLAVCAGIILYAAMLCITGEVKEEIREVKSLFLRLKHKTN